MKKTPRTLSAVLLAAVMAVAPGLDFTVQPKVLPDAAGFWDALYQAVARTAAAVSTDRIALAALYAVSLWLCLRFLYRKPAGSGAGEYLLCAFFSVMMMLNRAVRTGDGVALLYQNAFQLLKALLYLAGIFPLFLTALRGLNALLAAPGRPGASGSLRRVVERQTGKTAFGWLLLCWLAQIVIKYPGVLMWDTYQQIKQFTGEYARIASHPPLGTLLYGWMYRLGEALGNVNYGYFLFMLAQVAALLGVLAWSLSVMKRLRVSVWIRLGAFILYAVSPCYAGWATVICKDTAYLILCLYASVALLQFAVEGFGWFRSARRTASLCVCFILLWLTRYNGGLIVCAALAAMAVAAAVRRAGRAQWTRLAAVAVAAVLAGAGGNALLARVLNVQEVYLFDTLSLPFQQTARIVKLHGDEIPADEAEAIDRVLDYGVIGENYNPWYADDVKNTYRQTADAADRAAYLKVWLRQWLRYPADNLDALLNMNGVLFDLQFDRPMYVSLTDNTLSPTVYPYSFNDMTMYDSRQIEGLNAAQRMLTQWYFSFDTLPVIGWFASMGFCMDVMLAMAYLAVVNRRRAALWAFIPAAVTALGCLFVPVAYLRYALPYVCALPLWFAAYDAVGAAEKADAIPNESVPNAG